MRCWGLQPKPSREGASQATRGDPGAVVLRWHEDARDWPQTHFVDVHDFVSGTGSYLRFRSGTNVHERFDYVEIPPLAAATPNLLINLSGSAASHCADHDDKTRCFSSGEVFLSLPNRTRNAAVLAGSNYCEASSGGGWFCSQFANRGLVGSSAPLTQSAGIVKLFGSRDRVCGLLPNGIRCWNFASASLPTASPADFAVDAVAIASGARYQCALTRAGRVHCVGQDRWIVPTTGRDTFVEIGGLPYIQQIAGGMSHICALDRDGRTWCWGDPALGLLGDRDDEVVGPTRIALPSSAVAIGVGLRHSCAQLLNGRVFCWGLDTAGSVTGTRSSARNELEEYRVEDTQPLQEFVLSTEHSDDVLQTTDLATCRCGSVVCACQGWAMQSLRQPLPCFQFPVGRSRAPRMAREGAFDWSQLSNSCLTPLFRRTQDREAFSNCGPEDVDFAARIGNIVEIACGYGHRCGRTLDGRVFCAGANEYHQSAPIISADFVPPRLVRLRTRSGSMERDE
jgi:hypothetical protein